MYVNLHTMMAIGNGTTQDNPIQTWNTLVRHTADRIGSRKDDIGWFTYSANSPGEQIFGFASIAYHEFSPWTFKDLQHVNSNSVKLYRSSCYTCACVY